MSEWILIDPETVETAPLETSTDEGVTVSVYLSPYDIPEAVRSTYDRHDGTFTLQFKYLEDEPTKTLKLGRARVQIGRHSKRLYELEVPIPRDAAKEIEHIRVTIENVFDQVLAHKKQDRYRAARAAFHAKEEELLAALP